MTNVTAILSTAEIVAGGKNKTTGLFAELGGYPLIEHAVCQLQRCEKVGKILLALPQSVFSADHAGFWNQLPYNKVDQTPFASLGEVVDKALTFAETEGVLFMDVFRPFTSSRLMSDCIDKLATGAAAAAVVMPDLDAYYSPKKRGKASKNNLFSFDSQGLFAFTLDKLRSIKSGFETEGVAIQTIYDFFTPDNRDEFALIAGESINLDLRQTKFLPLAENLYAHQVKRNEQAGGLGPCFLR